MPDFQNLAKIMPNWQRCLSVEKKGRREIGKCFSTKFSSLRLVSTLNGGNREGMAKTFLTFRFSTRCREIGKTRRRLSLHFGSTLDVGKYGRRGEDFPNV